MLTEDRDLMDRWKMQLKKISQKKKMEDHL